MYKAIAVSFSFIYWTWDHPKNLFAEFSPTFTICSRHAVYKYYVWSDELPAVMIRGAEDCFSDSSPLYGEYLVTNNGFLSLLADDSLFSLTVTFTFAEFFLVSLGDFTFESLNSFFTECVLPSLGLCRDSFWSLFELKYCIFLRIFLSELLMVELETLYDLAWGLMKPNLFLSPPTPSWKPQILLELLSTDK